MSQPSWKCIGHIGDCDPIAHGGGFVYIDETGVYGPEMTWFEPLDDGTWERLEGRTPCQEYRILLENDPENEWWYDDLASIASFTGRTVEECQADAKSDNLLHRAWLYDSLCHYHGAENFDAYPLTLTEDEMYVRYTDEMDMSLGRTGEHHV